MGGLAARKPGRVFSALAHRGRPLADRSPARVVREAPSSENPRSVFAWEARQSLQEKPCWPVLRTAGGGGKPRRGFGGCGLPKGGGGERGERGEGREKGQFSRGKPANLSKKSPAGPSCGRRRGGGEQRKPTGSATLGRVFAGLEHFHQFCSRFVCCIEPGRRWAASK